jgi:hypothetical protein
MHTALSKVQVYKGTPPCQPGKCAICGTCGDENSEFLDFGLELDFYGVVYFCMTCVMSDVLDALDLVTRTRLIEVQDELEQEKFKYGALLTDNEELRGVLESLTRFRNSASDSGSDSDSEQFVVDEVIKEPESKPEPAVRKTTATKSRPVKQANERGSTNVRNNDSLKTDFDL